ncbi:MAG: ATP-binding cassette domain-containing protein [Candidatus Bathyarchaeia archaeon]
MGEFAIVMEDVVKRFEDVVAVNDVSLKVIHGELFGLLGPNGAGKTTTVNMLCGLLKPTSGFISVGGIDVQRENAKVKGLMGVCPQETAVYPYLTGVENVELFGDHRSNNNLRPVNGNSIMRCHSSHRYNSLCKTL